MGVKLLNLMLFSLIFIQKSTPLNSIDVFSNRNYIIGTWEFEFNRNSDFLYFQRKVNILKKTTRREMKISNNGELTFSYPRSQRRCGNDHRTYNLKTRWTLAENGQILKTTIPINGEYKKFRIIELTSYKMILSPID